MSEPFNGNLLPSSSSALERDIAAIDSRFDGIDMDLARRVRSPAETPAAALGHLAWEWSADVWDPAWPESIKRRVTTVSLEVHRLKGTVKAVRLALDALRIKTVVTEWWQTAPQGDPYTFHIRAFATARYAPGAPVITDQLTKQVFASVIAVKPVSRAFTFDIAASTVAFLGCGMWSTQLQVARPAVTAAPVTGLGRRLGAAAAYNSIQVARAAGAAAPLNRLGRTLRLTAAAAALTVIRLRMEARVS